MKSVDSSSIGTNINLHTIDNNNNNLQINIYYILEKKGHLTMTRLYVVETLYLKIFQAIYHEYHNLNKSKYTKMVSMNAACRPQ